MSKGFCDLHCLSTKKSAMTKVKARQHVNFMSNLIPLDMEWYIWLHIVCGHVIRMLEYQDLVFTTKNNN